MPGTPDQESGASAIRRGNVHVLVVDDEESMRHFLKRALGRHGYVVEVAAGPEEALELMRRTPADVLVSDVRMPGMDGLSLMERLREWSPGVRAVLVTAFGTIPNAIEAMRKGAESYLTKPFETDELLAAVDRAAEKALLDAENRALREQLSGRGRFAGLVGTSRSMRNLYRTIDQVARREGTVLISGESGTGKELVARAVHLRSPRGEGPFVAVHCGALPPRLLGVELLGAEAGAYTGAERPRTGYVERARGGTLFLDEVAEVPMEAQPVLLGLLEARELTRVGGDEPVTPDMRVMAATNRDLRALAAEGRFREDLLYRLEVLPIRVPPLREHLEDVPALMTHFLAEAGRPELTVPPHVMATLQGLRYEGNVRELRNLAERLASLVQGDLVELEDLPAELRGAGPQGAAIPGDLPYREAMERFEREYLERLLEETGGNVSEAARACGLSRPSLHARIAALQIPVTRYRRKK